MRAILLLFTFLIFAENVSAGNPLPEDSISFFQNSPVPDKQRRVMLNCTIAGAYTLSMVYLYSQWYSDYPKSAFHFFNDNGEWEQVDKLAHTWSVYVISKAAMRCYNWTGYDEKRSAWYGTAVGLVALTSVEVLDAFNAEWGFSGGDMIANFAGAGIFLGQQLTWKEQRIVLKFSFHQSDYSQYRPKLLGEDFSENLVKDYNGLTHWVSINPRSFFKNSSFPKWLSLGIGYGAEGMTGGKSNPELPDGSTFERYRQYYLAIDFDLSRIETKSKLLSGIFKTINFIHLPAPTIEFAKGRKPVYHAFYF